MDLKFLSDLLRVRHRNFKKTAPYDPQDALALGEGQLHAEANKYRSSDGINPATKAAIVSEHADPTESRCNAAIPCSRADNIARARELLAVPKPTSDASESGAIDLKFGVSSGGKPPRMDCATCAIYARCLHDRRYADSA